MSLSFNPVAFNLLDGLITWAAILLFVVMIAVVTLVVGSLAAVGPSGPLLILREMRDALGDLTGTSFRRIWAVAVLTWREARRRKALWAFGVFAVLFLFAGWFMKGVTADDDLQVKNYVTFVMRTISWLIMPVMLLLACWGLPEDIRARSLHTVVTKPVRRHEIVLGRIIGFSLIGSALLIVMGAIGGFWIWRQLPEEMKSRLVARVPIYGNLTFVDKDGTETYFGVNTGDENPFRSFIEGNTRARAIWDFDHVDSASFGPEGLVIESSFQSFRTHKGNIERQLLAQFTLVNPETNLRVPLEAREVREFRRNSYVVLKENERSGLQDDKGRPVDLKRDVLSSGKLRVETACLSGGQFLGMARPDLFVRLPDNSFLMSYIKSMCSIGLMMVMIVVLGVVSGCFLKGPVATLLAAFIVLVGWGAHSFLEEVTSGRMSYNQEFKLEGRGLIDGLIRIPTHKTPSVELEDTTINRIVKAVDSVELNGLWALKHIFPDFGPFDTTEYVANAFDVPWREALLPNLAVTIGFCLPWIIVGYFSLKVRELEAK